MKSKFYNTVTQLGLAGLMIFSPLAKGTVRLWALTVVEVAVFVLVFIWLWHVNNSEDSEAKFKKTKIDLPILLFVVLAAVSYIFSIYRYASILEIFRLLAILGIFYFAVNNLSRPIRLYFTSLIILIATGMSLFGFGQYFLGLAHPWWAHDKFLSSTYVNHNHFAGYLELVIPLAIGMVLGLRREHVSSDFKLLSFRIGLVIALIIMAVAFVLSQSRGAWASLVVALIIMNIALIRKKVLTKTSLFIFLFLIIVGIVYIFSGHDNVAARLRTVEEINQESFLEGRHKIWIGSLAMAKANPITGTGIGTFVWGMPAYRPKGLQVRADYAHNDYLHMMAEMGVLALPLMIWMIYVVIVTGFRGRKRVRQDKSNGLGLTNGVLLGCAVGILSLSLHALVDFNFHIMANMLLVACFAGIIMRSSVSKT